MARQLPPHSARPQQSTVPDEDGGVPQSEDLEYNARSLLLHAFTNLLQVAALKAPVQPGKMQELSGCFRSNLISEVPLLHQMTCVGFDSLRPGG